MELIEVPTHKYAVTKDPEEVLITKGLESCVGLVLAQPTGDGFRRGLAHIYHDGTMEFDCSQSQGEIEALLKEFPKNEKLQAYLFSRDFLYSPEGYSNPMRAFVINQVKQRGIALPDNSIDSCTEFKSPAEYPSKIVRVSFKDVIVHPTKIISLWKRDNTRVYTQKVWQF